MDTCSKCGFEILAADRYCGGCGLLLSGLKLTPEPKQGLVLFKPPLGTDRAILTVRNVGQTELNVMAEVEGNNRLEVADDPETRAALTRLAPDDSMELAIVGTRAHSGDRGMVILRFGDQRLHVPVSVSESPRLRLEPKTENARIVHSGDLRLSLEIDGPGDGQTELKLPLQLFGSQVRHALVVDRLRVSKAGSIRILPTTELPFTMTQDAILGMELTIPVAALNEADPKQGLSVPLEAAVRGMEALALEVSVVVRPRANIMVENWEAFTDDDMVLVRGVGDFRESKLELANRGLNDAIILAVVPDSDFVHVKQLPTNPVLKAREGTLQIPLVFNPDYLDEDRITHEGGDAIPLHLDVTFRSEDQLPETIRFEKSVRVMNAPELDGPLIIDFGTTNTCAAYKGPRGTWELVDLHVRPNETGDEFPSLIQFLDHDKLSQGLWEEALDFGGVVVGAMVARSMSRSVAAQFKSRLWSNAELWIQEYKNGNLGDPKAYPGEELARWFIKACVAYAERKIRRRIRGLFLTYPAIRQFDAEVREKLCRAAAGGTGIPLENIQCELAEPEALGYSELLDLEQGEKIANGEERSFAIVDVGGGTTDISIYKVRGKGPGESVEYQMLRSAGIDIAGEAVTFRIARLLLKLALESLDKQEYKQHYTNIWDELPEHWYEFNPARLKPHHHETFRTCLGNADACKRKLPREPQSAGGDEKETSTSINFLLGSDKHAERYAAKFKYSNDQIRGEISGLVDQIFETFTSSIHELKTGGQLPAGVVDRILLRGNGARLSYLRDRFEKVYEPKKISYDEVHPKTGVALGAAKYWHIFMLTGSGPHRRGIGEAAQAKLMRDVGVQKGVSLVPLLRAGDSLEEKYSQPHERLLMRAMPKLQVFDNFDGDNLDMPLNGGHGKELIARPLDLSAIFGGGDDRLKIRIQLITKKQVLIAAIEVQRRGGWENAGNYPVAAWKNGGWVAPEAPPPLPGTRTE